MLNILTSWQSTKNSAKAGAHKENRQDPADHPDSPSTMTRPLVNSSPTTMYIWHCTPCFLGENVKTTCCARALSLLLCDCNLCRSREDKIATCLIFFFFNCSSLTAMCDFIMYPQEFKSHFVDYTVII